MGASKTTPLPRCDGDLPDRRPSSDSEHGRRSEDTPGVTVASFDFQTRDHCLAALTAVGSLVDGHRFVWIDIDSALATPAEVLAVLPPMKASGLRAAVVTRDPEVDSVSSLARGDGWLQLRLVGIHFDAHDPVQECLDVVITEGMLVTVHRGESDVLAAVRRDYLQDFLTHAATPSFLVYEIWDKQIAHFLAVENRLDREVDAVRLILQGSADERSLAQLAGASDRLLALRKRVLPARRVLEELVSRKTTLVSEATLGFLATMIGTLERLLVDIAANREILKDTMSFSLTLTSHRTNTTMNRLAVVSTIFLPLTFLCGIYGMNFAAMPEIEWVHGYKAFWITSLAITIGLLIVLRRTRLL